MILGTSSEVLAATYATAAAKLLGGTGPIQTATREKARRFLMLALEFLS